MTDSAPRCWSQQFNFDLQEQKGPLFWTAIAGEQNPHDLFVTKDAYVHRTEFEATGHFVDEEDEE